MTSPRRSARPGQFDHDKRLRYRVGGYRGRPGDPLADFFIQNVIEPAIANAGKGDRRIRRSSDVGRP
jgi:hypothetical protein